MVENNEGYQDALKLYRGTIRAGDDEARRVAFQAMAPYFGKADATTLRHRREFNDLGFSLVHHDGMTHLQAVTALKSHISGESERVI